MKQLLFILIFLMLVIGNLLSQVLLEFEIDSTEIISTNVKLQDDGTYKYIQEYTTIDGVKWKGIEILNKEEAIFRQLIKYDQIKADIINLKEEKRLTLKKINKHQKELERIKGMINYEKDRLIELESIWIKK